MFYTGEICFQHNYRNIHQRFFYDFPDGKYIYDAENRIIQNTKKGTRYLVDNVEYDDEGVLFDVDGKEFSLDKNKLVSEHPDFKKKNKFELSELICNDVPQHISEYFENNITGDLYINTDIVKLIIFPGR